MNEPDPIIHIESFGGLCPVQAEGTIDGKPFYFRARGSSWRLSIGGEPVADPEWSHVRDYPGGPFDAGYMPQYEALGFIADAVRAYVNRTEMGAA